MNCFTVGDMLTKRYTSYEINEERIAVVFEGQRRSYDELDSASDRLAAGLRMHGFHHGDRVGVLMHNRLEWIELFFALAKNGGVMVPINYLLKPKEVKFIIEDCGATWLVYEEALADIVSLLGLGEDVRRIVVDGTGDDAILIDEVMRAAEGPVDVEVSSNDLLLLQYTSGTTGFPKGAAHTHSTILWNSYHQILDFEVTRDDTFLVVPALCWAAGFHDLALATLWVGGRVVLNRSTNFDPVRFFEVVEEERVSKTLLVPSVLKRVLVSNELERRDLSSLKMVVSGGEPVPVSSIEEINRRLPGCSLVQVYGMSEFPSMMLYLRPYDSVRKIGAAGKACSIAQIRVVGEDGKDVKIDQPGEILVRSPACMTGYYNQPEATNQTIVNGWMHTGDLATVDHEGYVYICGRAKDMIITGGLNVYPAEIERILAEHPHVLEAAVVGEPDEQWGEVGTAYVVVRPGRSLTPDEIKAWLGGDLANYKIPRTYNISERPLPRTTSGKVQKFLLKQVT